MAEKVGKSVSMVLLHVGVGCGVGYALTGNLAVSGAIALVEPVVAVAAHHVHERVWRAAKKVLETRRETAAVAVAG